MPHFIHFSVMNTVPSHSAFTFESPTIKRGRRKGWRPGFSLRSGKPIPPLSRLHSCSYAENELNTFIKFYWGFQGKNLKEKRKKLMAQNIVKESFINHVLSLNRSTDPPIPRQFLVEWLNILENREKGFVFPLELMAKWFGSHEKTKWNLKTFIFESIDPETEQLRWIQDQDYSYKKGTRASSPLGGRPKDEVLLTKKCFLEVCFAYGGKKSKLVQLYYTRMEELYRNFMYRSIESNMSKNGQQKVYNHRWFEF